MNRKFQLLFLLMALPQFALAGVNLKNGNFYMSYTDIVVPGAGPDLELARTYNSKAPEKGWFGIGWGTEFETNLVVGADGSVVIHENGSGARTRFTPRTAVDVEIGTQKIIEAMRKKSTLSDQVAKDLTKRLNENAYVRQAYAKKYGVKSELAEGTVLYSNVRGMQELVRVKSGYMRKYNDGKREYFDDEGHLTQIQDKYGYSMDLEWQGERLKSIKDSHAKQLFFSWYSDGKIKSSWSAGDKKTEYKYKGDNLVYSKDINENAYEYGYDANHNMELIKYSDGSKMEVTYSKPHQFAEMITDRKGGTTKYEYGSNPKNPDLHYWTIVKKKDVGDKELANRYEYEIKKRPDGSEYTYRILTEVDKQKTETIYSECCSLPLKITRGKDVTTFDYNEKGLLVKKASTKGEYIQLDYHDKFNKITKVVDKDGWTKFDYDGKGNLSKALNSKGKSVLLIYDRKGRITKMIDYDKKSKDKRSLEFKYNALGKPVEISMDKIGKINVAYDNYGEIKKVDSAAGHKMALQVTQAFQSLLAIVKPAGVNLSM